MIDLDRLDRAVELARYANLEQALSDLIAYREAISSPLSHALLRHFVLELCIWVENHVRIDA